jgi:hypothetical protein
LTKTAQEFSIELLPAKTNNSMADKKTPHIIKKFSIVSTRSESYLRPLDGVGQDRRASVSERADALQPSRIQNGLRADAVGTDSDRVQKRSSIRQTVQVTSWLKRPISSQVNQKAAEWGVSRSKAAALLVELGLANDILAGQGALIRETVSHAVHTEFQKDRRTIVSLQFRNLSLSAQLLHLLINLLSRQGTGRQVTAEQLDRILAWSRQEARNRVLAKKDKSEVLESAIGDWLESVLRKEEAGEVTEHEPS